MKRLITTQTQTTKNSLRQKKKAFTITTLLALYRKLQDFINSYQITKTLIIIINNKKKPTKDVKKLLNLIKAQF